MGNGRVRIICLVGGELNIGTEVGIAVESKMEVVAIIVAEEGRMGGGMDLEVERRVCCCLSRVTRAVWRRLNCPTLSRICREGRMEELAVRRLVACLAMIAD